ncbi:MAG: hypothetical protein K6A40_03360 [Solobacterium sp.]|nr:hypothetical protein [Solobacterium sp.]
MKKTGFGAARRRTDTPVSRRQRAVEYRHVRYMKKKAAGAETKAAVQTVRKEETPVRKNMEKHPAEKESVPMDNAKNRFRKMLFTNPLSGESGKAEQPEEGPAKEKTKKEQRRERKEEKIQVLVDTPRSSVVEMLLKPAYSMEKVSMIDDLTISPMLIFLMNVVKWFAFGNFLTRLVKGFLNEDTFGTARINFSAEIWMSVKIALFCLAAEYFIDFAVSIVSGLAKRPVRMFKLTEINGRSSLFTGVLFILSIILFSFNEALGIAMFIAVCVICLVLKGYSLDLILAMPKNAQIIVLLLAVAAVGFAGTLYMGFAFSDIIDMLNTVVHP